MLIRAKIDLMNESRQWMAAPHGHRQIHMQVYGLYFLACGTKVNDLRWIWVLFLEPVVKGLVLEGRERSSVIQLNL